jgi:hypothetical protein
MIPISARRETIGGATVASGLSSEEQPIQTVLKGAISLTAHAPAL